MQTRRSSGFAERYAGSITCPVCDEKMLTITIYDVPIDMCAKRHGVWFDAHELALVLMRSVRPT